MKGYCLIGLLALATVAAQAVTPAPTGTYNALDYGAKGNGTNDDITAVQQAVDACAADGGGQVLLPGGKIFLSGVAAAEK